jgi:hypothetical protein
MSITGWCWRCLYKYMKASERQTEKLKRYFLMDGYIAVVPNYMLGLYI